MGAMIAIAGGPFAAPGERVRSGRAAGARSCSVPGARARAFASGAP